MPHTWGLKESLLNTSSLHHYMPHTWGLKEANVKRFVVTEDMPHTWGLKASIERWRDKP